MNGQASEAAGVVRPTLPMAWNNSDGCPPREFTKIVVTDSAMAIIAHTGWISSVAAGGLPMPSNLNERPKLRRGRRCLDRLIPLHVLPGTRDAHRYDTAHHHKKGAGMS